MKKAWRIVIVIVIALAAIGAVCMGVGIMTGADWSHVTAVLNEKHHLQEYYQWFVQVIQVLAS